LPGGDPTAQRPAAPPPRAAAPPPAPGDHAAAPPHRRWRAHPLPWLLGGLTLLSLPIWLGERVFFQKDAQLWFYPSRLLWRARILAGDLPLWNPTLDLGKPFLADPGNGTLYPLNLLLLLPAPGCVGSFLLSHLLLALAGTFLLGRTLGLSRSGAGLAALGHGAGGYLVSMTWSGVYLLGVAWTPLVAALALGVARAPGSRPAALLAAALGCQMLAGELQGVGTTGLLTLLLLLVEPGIRQKWRAALGWLLLAGGLALLLAAPQLLPTLGLLPESARAGGLPLDEASHWALHPGRLAELLVPGLFGDPADNPGYLGFFLDSEGEAVMRPPWMITPYLGALTLLLAVPGLGGPAATRGPRAALLTASGLGLALALGPATPLFALWHGAVPGADLFRYPAKYYPLFALGVPLLAGLGLDRLQTETRRGSAVWHTGGGLVLLLTGMALLGLWAEELATALQRLRPTVSLATATQTVTAAWQEATLLLVGGAALLALPLLRRPAWLGPAALGGLAVQLLVVLVPKIHTTDPELYFRPPPLARQLLATAPPDGAPRLLAVQQSHEALQLGQRAAEELAWVRWAALVPNTAGLFGVEIMDAYDASTTRRRADFWAATATIQRPVLDLCAVSHLLLPLTAPPPPEVGLDLLQAWPELGLGLYLNTRRLPLARPLEGVLPAGSHAEALRSLRDRRVLSGRLAVIEPDDGPGPPSAPPAAGGGSCQRLPAGADELRFGCDLPAPAWIGIAASHYPGWTATLDGEPIPVRRANGVGMALRAPAGRHEVFLRYAEPGLGPGLALGGTGLLGVLLLGVGGSGLARRARRRIVDG